MTKSEALSRLERLSDASSTPQLDVVELTEILDAFASPDAAGNSPRNITDVALWAASTTYRPGDVVRTPQSPARWWKCRLGGVSDAVAPSWPTFVRSTSDVMTDATGARMLDGSVLWQDAGGEWNPSWDVYGAAAEAWRRKQAKAAAMFDFETDGQKYSRSQLMAHCQTMSVQLEAKSGRSGKKQLTSLKLGSC